MLGVWNAMDSTLEGAVIGALATALAAFFGFGGVILTIMAQGRQSRRAVAEGERRRIKASMYEDALAVTRAMVDDAIALSNELRMMAMQITAASQAAEHGATYDLPTARFPALSASYARFSDSAIKMVTLVENRLIIDLRLLIFRTALNSVLHDTRELMFAEFPRNVMPNIPTDNPAGGIFLYTAPILTRAAVISQLCDRFIDALGDAVAYSEDFLAELQNLLLGDLFTNKVQPRQPLDPAKRAITLDKAAELESWFRTSTAWGKLTAKVEADTIARFSNAPSPAAAGGSAASTE